MTTHLTSPHSDRLHGLDLARFLAFVGMVIVNFQIVMGAEGGAGLLATLTTGLEGRAAASFVVLAGIGLGLSARRGSIRSTLGLTLRRAVFLMAAGLINMLIFPADILHYYAVYFLFGAFLLPMGTAALMAVIVALNLAAVALILILDYDAGWNWQTYGYDGFWTPTGFVRNLFFNGWHPVVPWLGFLVFGIVLSRLTLADRRIQVALAGLGALGLIVASGLSRAVSRSVADSELALLLTTSPIPPMPLYTLAGMGAASALTGLCLLLNPTARGSGLLGWVAPAGRQTLTLYIAHIVIGMGLLEALRLTENQSTATALFASLVFCAAAATFAWLWSRRFRRGPVEALMRRLAG